MKLRALLERYSILVLLFTTFFTMTVFAETASENKILKIAFGNSLPPWVLPEQDKGILVDLARTSFQSTDYQVKPLYYPYARRIKAYKNGQVDVVTDITSQIIAKESLQGYLSDRFYYYENVAVSLSTNQFSINKVSDLSTLRVLAWQGAVDTLSNEYAQMAYDNPNYKETYKQQSQVEMLFRKRTDVIQLDAQIFGYFRNKVASRGKIDTSLSVSYAPIFGRHYCAFLFRSEKARDVFNEQIKQLKNETEKYQKIYAKYANYFSEIDAK